jgi:hypothetical protein
MVMFWNYYHLKNETVNLQITGTFSNFHIYSKMINKKYFIYLENYKHLL